MKTSDRTVIMVLAAIGFAAAFWMLVVAPKRSELADLDQRAGELESSIASLEAEADAGTAARDEFPSHYRRMVTLGKAVPSGHEEADLIVGLDRIGKSAGVSFRSIELSETPDAPPAPATELSQTDDSISDDAEASAEANGAAAGTPVTGAPGGVPATEADAATLPLGAAVGPAGLGVMGWQVTFVGDFFDINSVLDSVDYSVRFEQGTSRARGRLVTVDGFSLTRLGDGRVPKLIASMALRSYVTPEDEGLMLGATSEGPATVPVTAGVTP